MARVLPRLLLALGLSLVGGYLIGIMSEFETLLLAILGCLVGLASRPAHLDVRLAMASLVIGALVGMSIARVPMEPSASLAARSVVLNPVILAGVAVGVRLCWLCLRWAASPPAPSGASRPVPPPAGTYSASNS